MHDGPLTLDDLAARWKPNGKSQLTQRQWLYRHMRQLGLRSFTPGKGNSMRFRLADVLRAEERGAKSEF